MDISVSDSLHKSIYSITLLDSFLLDKMDGTIMGLEANPFCLNVYVKSRSGEQCPVRMNLATFSKNVISSEVCRRLGLLIEPHSAIFSANCFETITTVAGIVQNVQWCCEKNSPPLFSC